MGNLHSRHTAETGRCADLIIAELYDERYRDGLDTMSVVRLMNSFSDAMKAGRGTIYVPIPVGSRENAQIVHYEPRPGSRASEASVLVDQKPAFIAPKGRRDSVVIARHAPVKRMTAGELKRQRERGRQALAAERAEGNIGESRRDSRSTRISEQSSFIPSEFRREPSTPASVAGTVELDRSNVDDDIPAALFSTSHGRRQSGHSRAASSSMRSPRDTRDDAMVQHTRTRRSNSMRDMEHLEPVTEAIGFTRVSHFASQHGSHGPAADKGHDEVPVISASRVHEHTSVPGSTVNRDPVILGSPASRSVKTARMVFENASK